MWVCAHEYSGLRGQRRAPDSPGAGVSGDCALSSVGTEPGFSVTASALSLSSPLSCSLKLHKVDAFILPCASVLNGNEGTLRFSSHC